MIEGLGTDKITVEKMKNFNSSIGLQEVKTKGTMAALAGKTGAEIFDDYRSFGFVDIQTFKHKGCALGNYE
jgi:hypothetical protein